MCIICLSTSDVSVKNIRSLLFSKRCDWVEKSLLFYSIFGRRGVLANKNLYENESFIWWLQLFSCDSESTKNLALSGPARVAAADENVKLATDYTCIHD